ncbi:hypothetical protein [Micrococcoides hystricis]|uniref:Transporter n=1 Tax=Micrococcoides hystricis TaxID=1572761 RepID=A0ABV6PBV1_9MICC
MRWAIQLNDLRRSTMMMVSTIITWTGALFAIVGFLIGGYFLGTVPDTTIEGLGIGQTLVTVLLLVLWALLPIFLTGVDMTLDPARFAMYPIKPSNLALAIAGSAIVSPGVVITLALFLGMALMWVTHSVPAAIIGLLMAPVITVSAFSLGNMLAAWASNLLGKRRSRDILALVGLVILMCSGLIINTLTGGLITIFDQLGAVAEVLGWTPFGFGISAVMHAAAGQWALTAIKVVLALAWLGLIFVLWTAGIKHATANVTSRDATKGKTHGLGFFNRVPQTPTGAVMARSLTYWMRDPRYSGTLLILPVLPIVMYFSTMTIPEEAGFSGPSLAFTLGLIGVVLGVTLMAELSYDYTALSLHVLTGVSGKADRTGRAMALLVATLPPLILVGLIMAWALDAWELLPGSLGIALAGVLGGTGVSSVINTLIIYPTPKPGESPFQSQKAGFAKTFLSSIISMVSGLLATTVPIVLYFIQQDTGNELFGWLGLAAGIIIGTVVLIVGITIGGRIYDRRLPELYQQVALL